MRGGLALIAAACVSAAPGTAQAGRSFFGWMQGTEVMPERSVELQNWVDEENRIDEEGNRSESRWGVGPMIGITDQLELFLPLNLVWGRTPGMPGSTALFDYGVEARYRLVTMDPEEAPAFVPMLRVNAKRLVLTRDVMHTEIGFVGSYEAGSVMIGTDLAFVADISREDKHLEARTGLGVSVHVGADVRLGAEAFAQISLDDAGSTWAVAGPNMSWTHGRFWVSATYGIGLYQIKDAPRMQWGIAF